MLKLADVLLKHGYPAVELVEHQDQMFRLKISKRQFQSTIGQLIVILNEHKHLCNIRDFQVSETTLEQIFQKFASET